MIPESELRTTSLAKLISMAKCEINDRNVKTKARLERLDLIKELIESKGGTMPVKNDTPKKRVRVGDKDMFDDSVTKLVDSDDDISPVVRRELLTAALHAHLYKSARARGKDFNLTLPDTRKLITAKRCGYTGILLTDERGKPNTRSIERVDGSKGYIKGNVVAVSNKANKLKSSLLEDASSKSYMEPEEFRNFAKAMLKQLEV